MKSKYKIVYLLIILLLLFSPGNGSTDRHAFSNGFGTGLANGA